MTRGLHIIWVKVKISGNRHFNLNLPISLYAFEELLDCLMNLLQFGFFLKPKQQLPNDSSLSVHTIQSLLRSLSDFMHSLVGYESYDLVNIEVDNVKVSIKIR